MSTALRGLRRPGVAIFADIKILTLFIITIYKDSIKVKININYVSRVVPRDSYIFLIFFGQGITVPSFIIVIYV